VITMIVPEVVLSVVLALAGSVPSVSVTIDDAVVVDDVAQASRFFGARYSDTSACRIGLDRDRLRIAADAMLSRHVRLAKDKLYKFILLHEVSHCYDGDQPPPGVDPMEWREFLADAYGAIEMYAAGEFDTAQYSQLIRFRESLPGSYARNPIREARGLLSTLQGSTPIERIGMAKRLRLAAFVEIR
jgi:hypothetical protein